MNTELDVGHIIIPLATSCLLAPLVLFISVPNPTQLQSFLDIELGLPPLCTARILLGSVLRAARSRVHCPCAAS
jgi:hypothetical protein